MGRPELLFLPLLILLDGTGTPVDVPIVTRDDCGIARKGEPVTCGVPLPRSASVADPSGLRLTTDDGRVDVPAQFRVLARHDAPATDAKAPISWVAVEFDATVAAGGEARYRLKSAPRSGGPPAPAAASEPVISIQEEAMRLVLDTGVARFVIPRDRLVFCEQVEIRGTRPEEPVVAALRGPIELVLTPDGERAPVRSSMDASGVSVEIAERGPLHALVRVRGRLPAAVQTPAYPGALDALEIDARLRFQAGTSRVRVDLTVRNPDKSVTGDVHNGGREVAHPFREIALRVPLVMRGEPTVLCPDVPKPTRLLQGERFTLLQEGSGGRGAGPAKDQCPEYASDFTGFRARRGGGGRATSKAEAEALLAEGRRADGTAAIADERVALGVGVRDFWQAFPKSIRLGQDGLADVGLWPGEWPVAHRLRGGVQKTHRLVLDFRRSGPGSVEAALASVQAMTRAPLVAAVTPEALRDSEGLGWLSAYDFEHFPWYETAARAVVAYNAIQGKDTARQGDIYREMEDKDEYGWLHYGDHYREGSKNLRYWGNNEFDFGLCLLWQWARNADRDRRFFDLGEAAVRHLIDVDLYHTDRDLFWANHGVRKHDASGAIDHSRPPNLSHFWTGGLTAYYFLTGDEIAKDALLEAGTWLKARERDPKKPGILEYGGEVRSRGWAMQGMLDLYRVTGDVAWLDFAGRVSKTMVEGWISPDGFLPNSKGLVDPWMTGYVTEALGRYLLARKARHENDPGAERTLRRLLDTIAERAWIPSASMIAYELDPKGEKKPGQSSNISATQVDGFAYGFELFGKPLYLRMAKRCFESGRDSKHYPYYYSITLATPAKNAGFKLRFGQAWMRLVQKILARREPPRVTGAAALADRISDCAGRVRFETDVAAAARVKVIGPGHPRAVADRAFVSGEHVIDLADLRPDSDYSVTIEAVDPAKRIAKPVVVTFRTASDRSAPRISDLRVVELSDSQATVVFQTDEESGGLVKVRAAADSTVAQAPGPEAGEIRVAAGGPRARDFRVIVTGLRPGFRYVAQAEATDTHGNRAESASLTFTTPSLLVVPCAGVVVRDTSRGTTVSSSQPDRVEVPSDPEHSLEAILTFDLAALTPGATVVRATLVFDVIEPTPRKWEARVRRAPPARQSKDRPAAAEEPLLGSQVIDRTMGSGPGGAASPAEVAIPLDVERVPRGGQVTGRGALLHLALDIRPAGLGPATEGEDESEEAGLSFASSTHPDARLRPRLRLLVTHP